LSVTELRSFLKQQLPDYMLPAHFVFLESMPLLPNGKVDRGALPPSGATTERTGGAITAPRTEIEMLIAAVWRQVLKIETVGIDDSFFELGGHSLMAAEAAAKLRDSFGRPVSARDFFDEPTIAGLARSIEKMFREPKKRDFPPIGPAPRTRGLPLSPAQEPLFVFSQLFGGGDFLNMPYAYRLDGQLDVPALQRAIAEIVGRHAALRAGFRDTAAGPRQFVGRSVRMKLPLIDLAGLPQREKEDGFEQISKQDAAQTFDLEKPPLIRTKLLRLAGTQHILLVTMHHLTSDQWSMGVFRRELAALYDAFSKGRSSPLAELPVQFNDFVRWQNDLLKNGHFDPQISYWRQRLDPPSSPLEFRCGKNKKPTRYHSSRRPIECGGRLLGRIKAFARAENCTPFMVLVAALNVLLYRYTGESDIRIGTLVANRGQPGTEGLIGYFVNALVLRTRIRPGMTLAEVIRQVRETCVSAYAHQDLPFEHLETVVGNENRKREQPLYQVMLNYRNQSTPPLEANGLTIASWNGKHRAGDPGIAISRLDVNIHLRELATKLTGAVDYKTDLFDETAMTKFLESYTEILKQMVAHRKRRVAELKLLDAR
jgi:acyl carrier protein